MHGSGLPARPQELKPAAQSLPSPSHPPRPQPLPSPLRFIKSYVSRSESFHCGVSTSLVESLGGGVGRGGRGRDYVRVFASAVNTGRCVSACNLRLQRGTQLACSHRRSARAQHARCAGHCFRPDRRLTAAPELTSTTGVGTTSHFIPGTTWRNLMVLPSPLWVYWNARSCGAEPGTCFRLGGGGA
jgi:hypothetical protein